MTDTEAHTTAAPDPAILDDAGARRQEMSGPIAPGRIYGVAEAARLLHLNRDSLYRLCKARRIRHRRIGPRDGRIEFEGRWLAEFLAGCEVGPGSRRRRPADPESRPARAPKSPPPPPAPDWRSEYEAACS